MRVFSKVCDVSGEERFGLLDGEEILLNPVFVKLDIVGDECHFSSRGIVSEKVAYLRLANMITEKEIKDIAFYKNGKSFHLNKRGITNIDYEMISEDGEKDYIIGYNSLALLDLEMYDVIMKTMKEHLKDYTTELNISGDVYFNLFFLKNLSEYNLVLL